MTPAPQLSLGLLVKNNQKEIEGRLSRLFPLFKQVIAVDTGSTDDTPHLLKALGVQVLHKPFNDDFSELRNVYVEAATTPWILSLDSDEWMNPSELDKLLQLLGSVGEEVWGISPSIAIYHDDSKRLDSVFPKDDARLDPKMKAACLEKRLLCFRKNPIIRYRGIIHESVFKAILENRKKILEVDILVHNYGYPGGNEKKQNGKREWYRLLLEKQAKLTPKEPKPQQELGLSCLAAGEWDKALKCFRKATEKKNYFEAFLGLGLVLAHQKKYSEALEVLQTASADSKLKGRVFWERAQIHKQQKKNEEAEVCLKQALELVPNKIPVIWDIIRLCQERERWHEGLLWFQELSKCMPPDLGFWYYQGVFYSALNQLAEATRCFSKALELNPSHVPSLFNTAALLTHQKQWKPCRDLLQRILKLDPKHESAEKMLLELS